MIQSTRRRLVRLVAAVCLTVAAMLVGFAHRPLPGFATAEEIVAGSGSVYGALCAAGGGGGDRSDGAPTPHSTLRVCEACLIFAAPGLAAVAAEIEPTPFEPVRTRPVVDSTERDDHHRPVATARGPPRSARSIDDPSEHTSVVGRA